MLIELRVKNCLIFNDEVRFSMKADMRSRRFGTNIHKTDVCNLLKSAAIYGPNNSGKTCLINIMGFLKNMLLNEPVSISSNFFNENDPIARIGATFLEKGRMYSYDVAFMKKWNESTITYTYERFAEVSVDKAGREQLDVWLERDHEQKYFEAKDDTLRAFMPLLGLNNIVMYLTNHDRFESLRDMHEILTGFAGKIEIIDTDRMSDSMFSMKTISILKEHSDMSSEVVDFIRNADLYLDDIVYENIPAGADGKSRDEDIPDVLKLISCYKGVRLPSIMFDSDGTKRMEFLAGYIIEALHKDKILIIDELDSSLHFKLTRAIVSMFDSEVNDRSQLIFTTHDVSLLDTKKLFRKEQIWFVNKDDRNVWLYPLSQFTADETGIRNGSTDIQEKYRKGALGALPEPTFEKTVMLIRKNREK